jgi:hypothetical protein
MKYKAEIEIDIPKEELIKIYSKDILKWHNSIKKHELIEGEEGTVNAKYHVIMEQNGQMTEFDITIIKTVADNEWWIESIKENEFKMLKKLSFQTIGNNKTKVIEDYEFELIAFKQDVNKNLNAFKQFTEDKI